MMVSTPNNTTVRTMSAAIAVSTVVYLLLKKSSLLAGIPILCTLVHRISKIIHDVQTGPQGRATPCTLVWSSQGRLGSSMRKSTKTVSPEVLLVASAKRSISR